MASMCDEMSVIYEDGVENGLESVVERLAEERDRITSDLQKWFVNRKSRFSNERVPFEIQPKEPMQDPKRGFLAEFRTEVFHQLLYVPRHPLIDLLAAS